MPRFVDPFPFGYNVLPKPKKPKASKAGRRRRGRGGSSSKSRRFWAGMNGS